MSNDLNSADATQRLWLGRITGSDIEACLWGFQIPTSEGEQLPQQDADIVWLPKWRLRPC